MNKLTENSNTSKIISNSAPVGGVVQSGAHDTTGGLVLNHTKANLAQLNAKIRTKQLKSTTFLTKTYHQKLTVYGNTYELITYKNPQYSHDPNSRSDYSKSPTQRRSDSLWRTRNSVCRLCVANVDNNPLYSPTFVTLTFAKNIQCLRSSNQHFKYFLTKLSVFLSKRPKYVAVVEFQKRGAVHYHVVFFDLPFIAKEKLESLWSHGFTNIQVAKDVQDVSKYIGKYMSKDLLDKRLVGEKAYFTSRNLDRPSTYYDQTTIDNLMMHTTMNVQEVIKNPDYTIIKYRI